MKEEDKIKRLKNIDKMFPYKISFSFPEITMENILNKLNDITNEKNGLSDAIRKSIEYFDKETKNFDELMFRSRTELISYALRSYYINLCKQNNFKIDQTNEKVIIEAKLDSKYETIVVEDKEYKILIKMT